MPCRPSAGTSEGALLLWLRIGVRPWGPGASPREGRDDGAEMEAAGGGRWRPPPRGRRGPSPRCARGPGAEDSHTEACGSLSPSVSLLSPPSRRSRSRGRRVRFPGASRTASSWGRAKGSASRRRAGRGAPPAGKPDLGRRPLNLHSLNVRYTQGAVLGAGSVTVNKIGVCPRPRGASVLWEEVTPLAKLMC